MNKMKQLGLMLSVALLTVANANALLRRVGGAVGNVVSTTGQAATGALDRTKGTIGRVTGVRTESGLVGPRGRAVGGVRTAEVVRGPRGRAVGGVRRARVVRGPHGGAVAMGAVGVNRRVNRRANRRANLGEQLVDEQLTEIDGN